MSFVGEPQYTVYTTNLVEMPMTPFPFKSPAVEKPDGRVHTNSEYRKYIHTKGDLIRERNAKEFAKSL